MVFGCFLAEAQYSILYNDSDGIALPNSDNVVCQEILDSLHLVRIVIDDDAADNATVRLNFPSGINYLDNSLVVISQIGGLNITEKQVSLVNAKEFDISPASLIQGNEITFGYGRKADCAAIDFQLAGGTFKDEIVVTGDAGTVTESNINLANYDLLVPAISLFNEGPISTSVGSTVTREIRIVNGGLGYITEVNFIIDDETNTSTTNLVTAAGTVLTPTTSGTQHSYALDPSIIAQFGDGDQKLENGEEIVLVRTYDVLACDCSSSYQASWGCEGTICAETDILPQQTNIINTVPDLVVSIPVRNEEVCWDGSNALPSGSPVIQTVRVVNVGTGAAINFELTMHNYNPGSGRGRNYIGLDPWVVKNSGGAVIGTMTNPQILENNWMYDANCTQALRPATVVQEATGITIGPGETIYVEVPNYYSNGNCPTCPRGRSWMQLNAEYAYQDICEINTYDIPRHPLYNGAHNFQRYSLELPTDVHDGECFDLSINYQRVYTFLRRYNLAGGYTEAVLDLASSGLTYSGGATLNWNGVTLTATVVGGTLRLRFPPNIVHFGNLKVPVCISCANVGGGTIGFNMWHEVLYSDNCSAVPMDQECKTGTFYLHCPAPCPEGGATPTTFDLERISLGLVDQDDNGIPDNNNTADPVDVELNRAVNGDQVKGTWQIHVHPNTVGPNAGVPFNHVYVKFNTQKVNEGCATAEPARTSYFDALPNAVATINPASGGAPFTCSVNPVVDNNGIATYDLSSCKSSWEGGDEITFEAIFEVNAFVSKGGEVLYVADNEVYSSYVPNPSYADQHTCNVYNDYMVIYNLWHSPYMPYTQGISGCNNSAIAYIRQYISLQAPPGFFPNEYRNFGIPDQFIVDWPASQVYRPGSARFNGIPIPDANVSQTATQLIFTNLRQFFTTHGGSLFPPDEIQANYNVRWSVDPDCDAESSFTSRFTAITFGNGINTPTSWPSHVTCNVKHSGNANFEYDAPIPIVTGGGETQPTSLETCWEITLNNSSNSQNAENSWFFLEDLNNNLGSFTLHQGGTQIYPDANGFYRLGTNPASNSSDYTICTELTDCEDIALDISMGYHCTTYPTSLTDSECVNSITLTGTPAQSEIQVLLESYPLDENNTCAEQVVELAVTSAQASFLDEAYIELSLPAGVNIIGNLELEYPSGSGIWATVTPVLSGGTYTINIENHPGITGEGIPGTFAEPSNENREVILRFVVNNTGTAQGIVLNTYGQRPCGDPAINNGIETKTADLDPLVSDVNTIATICPGDIYSWEGNVYSEAGIYEVFKVNENGCNFSCVLYLDEYELPLISSGEDQTICAGTSASLIGMVEGGFGAETYQWQQSKNGGDSWEDIPGANSITYTTPDLLATTTYRLITIFDDPGCGEIASTEMTVTVQPESVVSNVVAGQDTLCLGESTALTVNDGIQSGGLIDYSTWAVGSGNITGFNITGAVSENNRIIDEDPWGNSVVVWEAGNDATSNADGGWSTYKFPIDNTKTYRFSVWINRKVLGANGRAYLGLYGYGSVNGVNRLTNAPIVNAYFWYSATPPSTIPEDEWVLVVGHVFPSTHTGTTMHPESGKYTLCDGRIGNTIQDFKWLPESIEALHRNYLFYSTDTDVRQQFVYPRVDVLDGTEPTLDELLYGLDATGGLGEGATYEWYSGSCGGTLEGTGPVLNVTPTETTTYYVRATGTCNTTECEEVTITVSDPEVTIADPPDLCSGESVLLTATGSGLDSLSYVWDDPSGATTDTVTVMPTATTTYTVTVTDGNGCTATEEVTVILNAPDDITVTNDGPITCSHTLATLTVTPAGSSYSWSSGGSAQNESVAAAGTYIVTVTNSGGCISIDSTVVTEDLVVPVTMLSDTALCIGESIDLMASGGGDYLWSTTETTETITVSPTTTTTYQVTVTSANGCSSTAEAIVTVNPLPDNSAAVWRHILCSPGKGWVYATQAYPGVPAYLDNTTFVNGGAPCGDQYVHTEGIPGYSVVAENIPSVITGGNSYDFSIDYKYTGTGLVYARIVFYDSNWTYISTVNLALPASGTWTTATVTAIAPPGAANTHVGLLVGDGISIDIDCFDLVEQGTGTIHSNSFETITPYSWTAPGGVPGAAGSAKGIYITEPGIYTVTITDPITGCQNVGTVEALDMRTTPDVVAINDGPLTCADTIVVLTASSAVTDATYEWSSGSTMATDTVSAAGIYTVTVTDPSNGCTAETTTEVLEDLATPVVSITDDGPLSCAQETVTLTAAPSGLTYEWTGGGTDETEEVTEAGTYVVTVTDTNGCTATAEIEIILGASAEINSITTGCDSEEIVINYTAAGTATTGWIGLYELGTPDNAHIIWKWFPTVPGTDDIVFSDHGLAAGDYEARIFTGEQLEICGSLGFTILPSPEVNAGPDLAFCEGETRILEAIVTSGAAPFSYSWTGPDGYASTDLQPSITESGLYSLEVTDANGCMGIDETLVYIFDCDQNTNCYFLDEFSTMSYFNSDGPLSWSDYSWDEMGDTNSASTGDIMIYGNQLFMAHTDASLPSIQRRVDLSGHSSAVLSFDFSGVGTLDSDDSFYVEVYDGTTWTTLFTFSGPFSATQMPWLDLTPYISADTEIRFGISSGFSDPGENMFLDNIRIDVNCLCEGIADAGIDVEICEGDTIALQASGGVEYLWSPQTELSDHEISNPLAFPMATTTYSLTVTDEFGCTDTDDLTITVNESLDAAVVAIEHDYCEDGTGEATITVTNGSGPFTINWETTTGTEPGTDTMPSPGSITITNLNGNTTYCFYVTDANGCKVVP